MISTKKLLKKIKAWIAIPDIRREIYVDLYEKSHLLADAQYPPAKSFFVEGLSDNRWWWRQHCISFLAFHYPLEDDIVDKIRDLLLNDPDDNVRMTAASGLGARSYLPDKGLLTAIQADPDDLVREASFTSILHLADVPYHIIFKERKRVESGEIETGIDEIMRILKDAGIDLEPGMLEIIE